MMQRTNGAWWKIVSKQLMQQSRKSLLIQFSVTMCNMLREADMFRGAASVCRWVCTLPQCAEQRLLYTSLQLTLN